MNAPSPDRLAGALARMPKGQAYFDYITSIEADRRVRAAFQNLVLESAPSGGSLFDFGAGPGIDVRFFAERGFTVQAYDVDPAMSEFCARYCADLIDDGRVTLWQGSYAEFLAAEAPAPVRRADLILSNFAPLNLVDDIAPLFARFHTLARPNGRLLASVLNPYCWSEAKLRWWWRRLPELWRTGSYFMPGPQAPHMRRSIADFERRALPYFKLTRVFVPARTPGASVGFDSTTARRTGWWHLRSARFMFLEYLSS